MRKKIESRWLLAVAVLLLMSCKAGHPVSSPEALRDAVAQCNRTLAEAGFQMTGSSVDDRNDLHVAGVSVSEQAGYGTAMGNDYSVRESYSFLSNDGRTLSYVLSYKPHGEKVQYVTDVSVVSCQASTGEDYRRYCGEVARIPDLPKDVLLKEKKNNGWLWGLLIIGVPSVLLVAAMQS